MRTRGPLPPRSRGAKRVWLAFVLALAAVGAFWLSPTQEQIAGQASEAIVRKDWPRARKLLLALHRRDPLSSDYLALLGQVCLRQGLEQEALEWEVRRLSVDSFPCETAMGVAGRAIELARPQIAESVYRQLLAHHPQRVEPVGGLARLYLAWHREAEMKAVISTADAASVNLLDDPALIWLWVTGVRVTWQDGTAESWLENVRLEQADDGFACLGTVERLLEEGRTAEAQKVAAALPKSPVTHLQQVRCQARLTFADRQFSTALEHLQVLSQAGPLSGTEWLLKARALQESGMPPQAAEAYAAAREANPWLIDAAYRHGRILALLEQPEDSELALQMASRLDDIRRRCLRQLQGDSAAGTTALDEMAELGLDIAQTRWAQLVLSLADRTRRPETPCSDRLKLLREAHVPPLSAFLIPAGSAPSPATTEVSRSQAAAASANIWERRISWEDATQSTGIQFTYDYGHTPERWLMETLGGGIAVLDYDGDGWNDLFFAQGGSLPPNPSAPALGLLWRNQRGAAFTDVSRASALVAPGFSHGSSSADWNNDGFPDLLVCRYGGLTWLVNQGDGTWREESARVDVPDSWSTTATFSDLDHDGDLDAYIAGYCDAPLSEPLQTCRDDGAPSACRPSAYRPEQDACYENLGDGSFINRTADTLLSPDSGYGLGVIAADFDEDGAAEIFVGNDTTANFLWTSVPNSSTPLVREDRGMVSGLAVDGAGRAEACMGIACGDYDGDQRVDLFVTNFHDETCTLYRNLGGLQFEDETERSGLSNAGRMLMGWGCQFVDADNDGWLDLLIANGYLHDTAQLPQFYRNRGGSFVEESDRAGKFFQTPLIGRAIAIVDWNRDGRQDAVVGSQTSPVAILANTSDAAPSVTLRLSGRHGPRDATGAVVRARIGTRTLVRQVSTQGGYLSSNTQEVVIGMGAAATIDELSVRWPGGTGEIHYGRITSPARLIIREGSASPLSLP